ncbi:MAG: hypothetical protein V1733_02085 [bacterium]
MKHSLFILLLVLASCSWFKKKSDRAVARVDDEYLYESELTGLVVPGTSTADSLTLTRNYIDSWIHRKALIHQAELNLTEEQMDFSKQLEDYRNSLVVYAYENALVRQKLDTVVSDLEIEEYYENNQENFLLKDNIVRISYVRIPLNFSQIRQIRKYFYSDDEGDRNKLADICDNFGAKYFLDDGTWLLFNDVLKEIPIHTYNQEEFLKNRRSLEIQDSISLYLARFLDFKIKESVSPLQFERDRIRSILLNKRKIKLLNTMHQEVYEEALTNKTIEIY